MDHRFVVGDRVRYQEAGGYPATVTEVFGEDSYRVAWDDGFADDPDEPDADIWRDHELVPFSGI